MSELEKMLSVKDKSQAIGEFLEFSGYVLCKWVPCTKEFHKHSLEYGYGDYEAFGRCPEEEHLMPVGKSINDILASYFDIDMNKVEEEKRQLLDEWAKQENL